MKNKIAILILISIYCLLLQTCKKDTSPCGGRKSLYNLTDTEKEKVPYKNSDTLIFINNSNDTAICVCTSIKMSFDILYTPVNNGDCDPDADWWEKYTYELSSNKSTFQLGLTLHNTEDIFYLYFNGAEFPLYLIEIGDSKYSTYIDSLLVKGKWYKSVNFAAKYFNPNLDKIFYNKEYGVIKIQNVDSTIIWELFNKK